MQVTHVMDTEKATQFARKWREMRALIALNLRVKAANLLEYGKVIFRYYRNLSFAKVDSALVASYLLRNPFQVHRQYLQEQGESNLYTYGETPLTTLDQIAQEAEITQQDVVYELGCGRGRTCFWLNKMVGCRVVGVEITPTFVARANRVQALFAVDGVSFREEDMLQTDLSDATVIYLYGSAYETEFIKELIERFKQLPAGAKIITTSYPLTDYTDSSEFEVMKVFPAQYTWGTADLFIHIKQ